MVILISDVNLAMARDLIVKMDSKDHARAPEIATNMRQSIQKLKVTLKSGYSSGLSQGLRQSQDLLRSTRIRKARHQEGKENAEAIGHQQ